MDEKSATTESGKCAIGIRKLNIPHLNEYASDAHAHHLNVRADGQFYANILSDEDVVLSDIVRGPLGSSRNVTNAYVRAGPRKYNFFDPKKVKAAIVTCGGLCPGLNDIIYHLFLTLNRVYGVTHVYGVRGGWSGFYDAKCPPMLPLSEENVAGIQHHGGTRLGTSRGGFDAKKICDELRKRHINALFVVGGDGTHRGAAKLFEMMKERHMATAVVGIPKTIDNDIGLIDRSFGFSTAVEEAVRAIRSARTEAASNMPNGIGVVKLMGRHAGFIAAHATLASGEVDLCLIPEFALDMKSSLDHVSSVLKKKGSAVVVIAEGAGAEVLLKGCGEKQTNASGKQPELPPIGPWFVDKLKKYLAENRVAGGAVKYIDPSYIIRSVPANAADSLYCMMLAQNAVHAAMAGFTGCSVGLCNNRVVLLPISELVRASPRTVNSRGRTVERMISITQQPRSKPLDPAAHSIVG